MNAPKNSSRPATAFFLSALFFVFTVAAGIFVSYRLDVKLFETLSQYLTAALSEKAEFKEIFLNAVKCDFRYSLIVLVCALSIYSSFFPFAVIGFKGFSSGLAVALASRSLGTLLKTFVFSFSVFFSSVLTVPVYVLMFVMGCKFAARNRRSTEPKGKKFKNYLEFFAAVLILFAILCFVDLLQASLGLLVYSY